MMKVSNLCVILLAAQLLISCGGGGGGSGPSIQPTPASPVAPPTPAISSNLESQAQGTINGTINYENIDRTFILYVPSSYEQFYQNNLWYLTFMAMAVMPASKWHMEICDLKLMPMVLS